MSNLSIDSIVFEKLKDDPSVNRVALANLVYLANSNSVLNVLMTKAEQGASGAVKFYLAGSAELSIMHAAAFFDPYTSPMRVVVDPEWLVGSGARLAVLDVNNRIQTAGIAGLLSHELDHYVRAEQFKALDILTDPAQPFNGTLEERFTTFVTESMKVEVLGWYADLKAQQYSRTNKINGVLSELDLKAVGLVESALYVVEQRGMKMGLSGDALIAYVAENGAPILSQNQGYWERYRIAMSEVTPGVDSEAIRKNLGYKLDMPENVIDWREYVDDNNITHVDVVYRSGLVTLITRDENDNLISAKDIQSLSGGRQSITTYYVDGRFTEEIYDSNSALISQSKGEQIFSGIDEIQTDLNGDSQYETDNLNTGTISYNLNDPSQRQDAEYFLSSLHTSGIVSDIYWDTFTRSTSSFLLTNVNA